MLVYRDLGFLCAFLLVIVCAVLVLLVKRKCRVAVAREAEIKRLLSLASEEAYRAELEASAEYSSVVFSPPPLPQCALCYSPTTTRCSRCKAVRYCSGRCQIIHWRQGHREQCHPCSTDYHNDRGSNAGHKAVKQESIDNYAPDGRRAVKSFGSCFEDSSFTNSPPSSKVLGRENDSKQWQQSASDGAERTCNIKSSSASVSTEFVPSAASSSVFADAYVEKNSSSSLGRSSRHQFADVSRSRTRIKSVDNYTSLADFNSPDTRCELNMPSDSGIDISEAHSCDAFSSESNDSLKENCASSRCRGVDGKSCFTGSGEGVLQFSFNLSGNITLPYDSIPKPVSTSEVIKLVDSVALSEKYTNSASRVKTVHSSKYPNDLQTSEPRDAGYLLSSERCAAHTCSTGSDPRNIIGGSFSPKSSSKRSDHVFSDSNNTTQIMRPRKVEPLSTGASNVHPSLDRVQHSLSGDKFGKLDIDRLSVSSSSSTQNAHVGRSRCPPPNIGNGLKTSMLKVVDHMRPSKLSKHYQGPFPYDLFVKLYNSRKVELRPCGLMNCGNSCYANVVLQCLAFTPPLTAYLSQGFHSKTCEKSEWCFTCEFEKLILKAKEGKSPLSPAGILSQLGRISSNLISGKEEDAHEFLRYVIDTMQSVCLKEVGINGSRPEEETSLIGLTFGGYLRSKIRCMKCRGKSERHERLMDLILDIEGDIGSLEEALTKFIGTEILDGENRYKCCRCKSYEKAKKKLTILEAPNVLTIALKRFQTGKFGKLNKSIQFSETLNLSPYMSTRNEKWAAPILYSLYGVVVHVDIMNAAFSGHYICYVKNTQKQWFKIDDSTVKSVERDKVLSEGAYMLLYARDTPRSAKVTRERPLADPSLERKKRYWEMETSSSSNSSLISGSDEAGSWTTDSNRDSSSNDDFSDYVFRDTYFGEAGKMCEKLGHNDNCCSRHMGGVKSEGASSRFGH